MDTLTDSIKKTGNSLTKKTDKISENRFLGIIIIITIMFIASKSRTIIEQILVHVCNAMGSSEAMKAC